MLNGLLALHQDAPKLILSYGACAVIILAALFALVWTKSLHANPRIAGKTFISNGRYRYSSRSIHAGQRFT